MRFIIDCRASDGDEDLFLQRKDDTIRFEKEASGLCFFY